MTLAPTEFVPVAALQGGTLVSIGLPVPVALALAGGGRVYPLGGDQITQARVQMLAGAVFACPLMAGTTDALGVIEALQAAGFTGTLLVVAPHLPNPGMVEGELRAAVSGFGLRLLSM